MSGLWLAWMFFGGFITVKGHAIDSPMKCGVVRTYVVSQKPIKLSQGADCSYVQGIKPTLFQSAEMAFYLAFASPITDTGMQQKDSKEYAGQVSNSGRN